MANYSYTEDKVVMNKELQAKLGAWVEEGTVCYGIVVTIDQNQTPKNGKTYKSKSGANKKGWDKDEKPLRKSTLAPN